MRDVRVLAQAVRTALEAGDVPPAGLADSLRELAVAVGRLPAELAQQTDRHAVLHALHAAEVASAALDHGPELPFSVVIAQIRAVAVDLLRALQVDRLEAAARVGDLPSELT